MSVVESDIWYTITQGKLFYSPRTPIVDELIRQVSPKLAPWAVTSDQEEELNCIHCFHEGSTCAHLESQILGV